MTKRNFVSVLLLIVFLFATGCQAAPTPSASPASTPTPAPSATPAPPPTPTPDPVEEALSAMTTEEKVGQLLIAGFYETEAGEEARSYIQDYHVGGLILYGRNVESAQQLTDLTNGLKALAGDGIPLFLSTDQEGGMVERMPPEIQKLPNAYDVSDPAPFGAALGTECAAFGLNTDFAPSLDIWSNPNNTVIGRRAFGSDAETVTQRGLVCLTAMEESGTIPVVKHFPGHGDTDTDSHVGLPVVDKTREELLEMELLPFQAAIDAGAPAVMVGHILMTQIDPDKPATLSSEVVTGLLREELGFDGVVFTDDLTMGAITQNYGLGEAAVLAVEAGCDVLLVCHEAGSVDQVYTALLDAVDTGRITEDRLDQSVRRILTLKQDYGLTSDPVDLPDLDALNAQVSAVTAG